MGRGQGRGQGPGGGGGGRIHRTLRVGGSKPGAGPAGNCLCPNCGHKVPHVAGQPCYQVKCPKCGTQMVRE